MLTIRLGASDLASIRFSVSPLIELWQSVRALESPVDWDTEFEADLGDVALMIEAVVRRAGG